MSYGRTPYALRYLVAFASWLAIVSLDIILRIAFVPVMPFFIGWSGFGQTQHGAQLLVNLVDFYTRPLMRMPRADWRKLLGRGGGDGTDGNAKPIKKLSDAGV